MFSPRLSETCRCPLIAFFFLLNSFRSPVALAFPEASCFHIYLFVATFENHILGPDFFLIAFTLLSQLPHHLLSFFPLPSRFLFPLDRFSLPLIFAPQSTYES